MEYFCQEEERLSIYAELRSIEDAIASIAHLVGRSRELHKRLEELDQADGDGEYLRKLEFRDSELSVRWNGGRLKFREDGKNAYRLFRAVFEAGEEGIDHADAAEIVFGDQCANLKRVIESVRQKANNAGFPYDLENDGKILKFF